MADSHVIQQPALKWSLFLSACIFAGGLLLKVGAPVQAVGLGIGLAALWNWKGPRAARRWGRRPPQ